MTPFDMASTKRPWHGAAKERTVETPSPDLNRTLIVGAGSGGELIARELRKNLQWKMWPIGFVDDDPAKIGTHVEGTPVLGDSVAIPALVDKEQVDTVVLAMPSASQARREELARIANDTGVDVVTMPSIGSVLSGQQRAQTLRHVRMTDVLGRTMVEPDRNRCLAFIRKRTVMITGAAGSIGSELAAQVADLQPSRLIVLDANESGLFDLQQDLLISQPGLEVEAVVATILDEHLIDGIFKQMEPDIVFHTAAYKHVPLMEQYPGEAIRTNVVGTRNIAQAAARHGTRRFVLVSTDKAVRPTSVMGATKRLAEIVLADVSRHQRLSSCSVRFGNVLGSRGSVVPTFERQIRAGGPVTVTDARMRRYFMTVEEAASLIIQSGAFGERNALHILDMGDDVSILELAERVISLHGLRPYLDIPIEFIGIRPGEKLRENLAHDFERARPSPHPKIRTLGGSTGEQIVEDLADRLAALETLSRNGSAERVRAVLHDLVTELDRNEQASLAQVEEAGEHRPRIFAVGQ